VSAPTASPAAPAHHDTADETILLHQFDDLEQQELSSTLGMWAFLATEVMFFGGLVFAFFLYRNQYHDQFVDASSHLNVWLGAFNTLVLLTSSLTMALAVRAARLKQRANAVKLLIATMVFGTAFLGVKAVEWTTDYHEELIPGIRWNWKGPAGAHHGAGPAHETAAEKRAETATGNDPTPDEGHVPRHPTLSPGFSPGLVGPTENPDYTVEMSKTSDGNKAQMFFVLYFFMTGLHAIHMIIGIAIVAVIAFLTWNKWLSGVGATHIEMIGLYWHFVDIVWVYLYPILYLISMHKS
jgi:cytochrome c oxidase subunit 3